MFERQASQFQPDSQNNYIREETDSFEEVKSYVNSQLQKKLGSTTSLDQTNLLHMIGVHNRPEKPAAAEEDARLVTRITTILKQAFGSTDNVATLIDQVASELKDAYRGRPTSSHQLLNPLIVLPQHTAAYSDASTLKFSETIPK
jgi:hypothetical protein